MPVASLLLVALSAAPAAPAPLTAKERAGRAIYHEGKSASGGAVNALVGGTTLSAEQVSCAGCHGEDGLGRPEGGVTPTPIRWRDLTTPWGRKLESGRKHPPYDERTLGRAITDGIDAGGNPLDPVMPRYSMSRQDLEALVAYVKRLGDEAVPGVGPGEVRIGTILPATGPFAELAAAMRAVLEAWASETNAAGGVHGRRVALHVASYDPARDGGLASARSLLARHDLLALVSGFTPAVEPELAALADEAGVPLVGPLTPWPIADTDPGRVFYLLGGPREHARVLAGHAIRELPAGGAAFVLHVDDDRHADAARAAAERFRAAGWGADLVPFARGQLGAEAVAPLASKARDCVVFLGDDGDLAAFLREAAARDYRPHVLASGALAGRAALAAPASFQGRLVLAMPTIPSDESAPGREALARAGSPPGGGQRHHAARASARAAAQLLAEGLRRAGRGLSRERLAAALEGVQSFETGVMPPLSFGPDRRIGVKGAWLVAADVDSDQFRVLGWSAEN